MSLTEIPTDRNGIEPQIWGKSIWETLHYVSMDYPEKPSPLEISRFFAFFESLMTVLPCETCREHYEAYWKAHPIANALTTGTLKQWVLDLHNAVNRRLGKPEWGVDQLHAKYGDPDIQPEPVFSLMVPNIPVAVHVPVVQPANPKPKPKPAKATHHRNNNIRRNFGAHDLSTALPTGPKKKCKNCGKK